MTKNSEKELLENLKNALDAFVQKGRELGEGLDTNERNAIIKKGIYECLNTALDKIARGENVELTQKEISEREGRIRNFTKDYCKKKIAELDNET